MKALYICYLSLDDPLVHSQVVAYLDGLTSRGHEVHLLTFEPQLSPARAAELESDLAGRGITWHRRRYHKRPSLPATIFDVLAGSVHAVRLIRRHRLDAVHARSHVPAAMALVARRFARFKLLFDLRGLWAEEYADAGIWKRGGVPFRITKRVEGAAIARADAMVVLTNAVKRFLFGDSVPLPLEVIPCCADLKTIEAQRDERDHMRAQLGVRERPVLLYVGKFTGWYMEAEMVAFFAAARELIPDLLFLIVTQADHAPVTEALNAQGIAAEDFHITSSPPGQIGRYLAAADAGIALIRPCLSKISSSPTKLGEYLGGGLPVVSGPGIGDVDALLASDRVGVVLPSFDTAAYDQAAKELADLLADSETSARCRKLAHRELSLDEVGIPRYNRLYTRLSG